MQNCSRRISQDEFRLMKSIVHNYFVSLDQPRLKSKMSAQEKLDVYIAKEYIKIFKKVYDSLTFDEQKMIRCLFLEPERASWIKEQYSLSQYYRLRNKAINKFVERFYR